MCTMTIAYIIGLQRLLEAVCTATESGKAEWGQTSADEVQWQKDNMQKNSALTKN